MSGGGVVPYAPMTLVDLAGHLARESEERDRWLLVSEFLEEYRWEDVDDRPHLVEDEPPATGDERWDVFLAALAEHLRARDGRAAPAWAEERRLREAWLPYESRVARVDALVHAPAAFRRRGVFVAARDLEVA